MTSPGAGTIRWRRPAALWIPLAWLAALAWPPLIVTLLIFPPQGWSLLYGPDWRFVALMAGALATPAALAVIARERKQDGHPGTRLGVIWRFALYGAVLSVVGQLAVALVATIAGWAEVGTLSRGLGAAETNFLIFGVGMMPFTMAVGLAYAAWAGLAAALIAFEPTPPPLHVPVRYFGDGEGGDARA